MNDFNYTIVKCKVNSVVHHFVDDTFFNSVELALEQIKYLYETDVFNDDSNYVYEIVSIE
ncbi:hypothetical protein [Brochothrix thermosphacta]|uniref:hypothetical protein n=1 Tax=Brochothrix thermosphacta TaxID=2756 RepID=UPI00083FAB26|nr:hypothetical protein [Brochothrix thermosphacta]ODJ60619.1 hypothetical protein BFR35_12405 [Brochothrix thermosphacta]